MWKHVVEETRRKTEDNAGSTREEGQENAGKCGKKLHKFKGHEDGKLEGASRKEGEKKPGKARVLKRVAVRKTARSLEGDNCSTERD